MKGISSADVILRKISNCRNIKQSQFFLRSTVLRIRIDIYHHPSFKSCICLFVYKHFFHGIEYFVIERWLLLDDMGEKSARKKNVQFLLVFIFISACIAGAAVFIFIQRKSRTGKRISLIQYQPLIREDCRLNLPGLNLQHCLKISASFAFNFYTHFLFQVNPCAIFRLHLRTAVPLVFLSFLSDSGIMPPLSNSCFQKPVVKLLKKNGRYRKNWGETGGQNFQGI